jgi:hypothetical protein
MARTFGPVFEHGDVGFYFHIIPIIMTDLLLALQAKAITFEA